MEFRFSIVDVGIQNRTVGPHWNGCFAGGFSRSDSARFARANVEICGRGPFFAGLREVRYKNGFFSFFVQVKVSISKDGS
jgi:hypothetical protein